MIEEIKAKISIRYLWRLLDLPGQPGKDCRSPFRDDLRPSFSVYLASDGYERFYDHGTGKGGDVIDFYQEARGVDRKSALGALSRLAGIPEPPMPQTRPQGQLRSIAGHYREPDDMRSPTCEECQELGALRSLDPAAFDLAAKIGVLHVATVRSEKSWVAIDQARIAGEARRFDGRPYLVPQGEIIQKRKSQALVGSHKDWPLGLETFSSEFNALKRLVLVEGLPDYFAALHLALLTEINFRPVAMLGAACSIGPQARKFIAGSQVLVIPHNDPEGQAAAKKWTQECLALGAIQVIVQTLPFEHDDLNDFLRNPGPDNPIDLLKGFNNADSKRKHL